MSGKFIFAWVALAAATCLLFAGAPGIVTFGVFVTGLVLVLQGPQSTELRAEIHRRLQAVTIAKSVFEAAKNDHSKQVADFKAKLESLRAKAGLIYREIEGLAAKHAAELQKLETSRRDVQLRAYLDKFFINPSFIRGLGPKRHAMLRINGIETAADVIFAKYRISGIPRDVWFELEAWAEARGRKFQFNANEPIPAAEKAKVGAALRARKSSLVASLKSCSHEWSSAVAQANQVAATMVSRCHTAEMKLRQAEADHQAVP